ncbi:ABC transporter substrate-binding protein [Marinomonas sp. PE14-40]|uniref:ABC transporter substrate-binding protein n=1 Tax=Marinomonas sp. PE14-40 TaxID=3060621 RepID=UPI003F674B68
MFNLSFLKKTFSAGRRKLLMSSALLGVMSVVSLPVVEAADSELKILHSRSFTDIQSLDPAFYTAATDEDVMGAIYNKLIYYKAGKDWEWELQAAKSIKQIDDTHIAFELKPGIMFSNGFGEMTAEDVKFSYERIIDPELASPVASDWGTLDHVEVTGKYTGVIVLKEAFQPLWNITLPYAAGNILSKKAVESVGGKFGSKPPAISGPFQIKEWKPKQVVILERNPLWTGKMPVYDEIHIHQIDDEKTAEIAFEAGDIDFTRISLSSLQNYREAPPKDSLLSENPSLFYVWVGINQENSKLLDPKVRQAIQLSIDVPSILAAAYFDAADAATGIIAPGLTGHREKSILAPAADYAKAKQLLNEAGYGSGLDLSIDILNKSTFVTAAQIMQATMATVGIRLTVNLHESGSFWALGSESSGDRWKNIELVMNRFSMTPDPYYASQWFVEKQVGVWNWERFRNQEFDELHEKALSESSEPKRSIMYQKMQDIMEESGSYRFITHESTPIIYRNAIVPALRPDGTPLYRSFQ